MPASISVVSNELDDFVAGGLYNGGRGIIQEFYFRLWDYGGSQPPDSVVAVYCRFQPTDGSGDGKDQDIFWSAGPANQYQPNETGGGLIAVGSAAQLHTGSNWAFVQSKFRDNCGLEKGKLNGATGIRILEGTELTIVRVDQPTRDGIQTLPAPGQQQARKPQILIPTAAIFPWDKKGGTRTTSRKATPATTTTTTTGATTTAAATASTPPSASPNGNNDNLLANALGQVLMESGGSLEVSAIPKALTTVLGAGFANLTVSVRMDLVKQAKNPESLKVLADSEGWNFDGTTLSV